jgi:hypothetical protein
LTFDLAQTHQDGAFANAALAAIIGSRIRPVFGAQIVRFPNSAL